VKHEFRSDEDSEQANMFREWLENETINGLEKSYGDGEAVKAVIFLFVSRAFEAHMPEKEIAQIFGRSVVKAGYLETDEDALFSWLEYFAQIARGTYSK